MFIALLENFQKIIILGVYLISLKTLKYSILSESKRKKELKVDLKFEIWIKEKHQE